MEGMQSVDVWGYEEMSGGEVESGANLGTAQCTATNLGDQCHYATVRTLKAFSEKIDRLTVSENCPDLVLKLFANNFQTNDQFS